MQIRSYYFSKEPKYQTNHYICISIPIDYRSSQTSSKKFSCVPCSSGCRNSHVVKESMSVKCSVINETLVSHSSLQGSGVITEQREERLQEPETGRTGTRQLTAAHVSSQRPWEQDQASPHISTERGGHPDPPWPKLKRHLKLWAAGIGRRLFKKSVDPCRLMTRSSGRPHTCEDVGSTDWTLWVTQKKKT